VYELRLALRYLLPKKRAISTSIISIISFIVISLVVWLCLVFLSVTSGLEENWLSKLTQLNAPLRITPTSKYYSSYYYLIDTISQNSDYETKTIAEKLSAPQSNPYQSNIDADIPYFWPQKETLSNGSAKDLVKDMYSSLQDLQKQEPSLYFQDYEMSGAFLRLSLSRDQGEHLPLKTSFLSQMSYLLSFQGSNPHLKELMLQPTVDDINHLLIQPEIPITQDAYYPTFKNEGINRSVLDHIDILEVKSNSKFSMSGQILPEGVEFSVKKSPFSSTCTILNKKNNKDDCLKKVGDTVYINKEPFNFHELTFVFEKPVTMKVIAFQNKPTLHLEVETEIQGRKSTGSLPFLGLTIEKAKPKVFFDIAPKSPPFWAYYVKDIGWKLPEKGVLLPKSYKDSGILIGDPGYLAYNSTTASSSQEQRISFKVAGFYDPGVMPTGNRFIFAPQEIVRTINASSSFLTTDSATNGIMLWTTPIKKALDIKPLISSQLKKRELDSYWKVESYEDYEFSKDLIEQFKSDKLLFTLIALIILVVACSNIISMLLLLINDKKQEIAILLSMGATRKSISLIFGLCGFITGLMSSFAGILAAIFTLKNLDVISSFLSSLLGHQAFNASFFGDHLPNHLSYDALFFIAVITPIIALIAGLVPAIKASRLKPSSILRSQ